MPGVNITTAVRTGPVGTSDITASQVFMVGEAERGPTDGPTLLRSFSDYTTYYGNYESGSLYAHVKTFFDEGGTRCYVQRVVGSGSSAGTLSLADSASATVLSFTAKNAGDWSANLTVEVADSDTTVSGSDSFKLKVALDGKLLLTTRNLTSVTEAATVINSSSVAHLLEATATELNTVPVTVSAQAFSPGSDGSAVSASDLTAGLDLLSPSLKSGAVCIPGQYGSTIWEAIAEHAAANNRIAILSFDPADTARDARDAASAYYGVDNASHMAFYWPHVKVAAPNSTELATGTTAAAGTTITISPEAYVAGARARAVVSNGPWRAGAGQISKANTIVALAQDVTAATGETMDASRVNVIRNVSNSIRVYGARSVSSDEANWRYITMRDTMNYISVGIEERMEEYVFETIDARGNLFGRIRASIKAFLDPIRGAGGLYEAYDEQGVLIDPGYNVVVDGSINPVTQLSDGLVRAEVGVRVSGVADLISIVITKSNLSAPVI